LITNKQTVQAAENFPPFVSGRGIDYDASFPNKSQVEINTYIIISSSGNGPSELIGTYENREGILFEVYAGSGSYDFIYLTQGAATYKYGIVHSETTKQETLKLGTFVPPEEEQEESVMPPTFAYEWYTPACKPAIYLYPETETNLSVYLKLQGKITDSRPEYRSGWTKVIAKPNGELNFQNQTFPYLYYEAEIADVAVPKRGWVVQKEVLPKFFDASLSLLGLNQNEINDFKGYWLNKLTDKSYYFVGLLPTDYLNQIEKIEFSQKPETFIRVRYYFAGLDQPVEVNPGLLPEKPLRQGFTAVDWGGMLENGSCREDTTNQILSK